MTKEDENVKESAISAAQKSLLQRVASMVAVSKQANTDAQKQLALAQDALSSLQVTFAVSSCAIYSRCIVLADFATCNWQSISLLVVCSLHDQRAPMLTGGVCTSTCCWSLHLHENHRPYASDTHNTI